MLRKLRPRRPSHASVVAYLALFVALGGTGAYAANTVFSSDIADNQVYPADVRDDNLSGGGLGASDLANGSITTGEVRDDTQFPYGLYSQDLAEGSVKSSEIADSAVGSSEVQNNSLTGSDILESSLGKVPDADKLDGLDSSGFIHGQGSVQTFNQAVPDGGLSGLLTLPNLVSFDAGCNFATSDSLGIKTESSGTLNVIIDTGGSNPGWAVFSPNEAPFSFPLTATDYVTLSAGSGGRVATIFLGHYRFHNPVLNQDFCQFQGHAIEN